MIARMLARVLASEASPSGVLLRKLPPDRSIEHIRALLMAGYGSGASRATINAVTRDRGLIAGRPGPLGLEDLAQQTVVARGDTAGVLTRVIRVVRRGLIVVGTVFLAVYAIMRRTSSTW